MAVSINLNSTNASSGVGIDVTSVVDQILYTDRANERLWQSQVDTLTKQASDLTGLGTYLSNLQNAVNDLKDVTGSLTAMSATSSAPDFLGATAQSSAAPGTHLITIGNLATTSSYYTGELADSSTTFSQGSFTLQVGNGQAVAVTVDSTNNTLDKLASYINQQNLGVSATVVSDAKGARLALVSNASGDPGDLTISDNTTGLSFTKAVTGRNASLTIDGVPVSSNINTVNTAIPGVTLNLLGQSDSEIRLTVASDTTQATAAITTLVNTYNKVIQGINTEFTVGAGGPLATNSMLRAAQDTLLSGIGYSIEDNNGIVNLQSLGVEMANDGTLSVNSTKLNEVLANHFSDFKNFFQAQGTTEGFAYKLSDALNTVNAPSSGIVAINQNEISTTTKMLTDQISSFEDRLVARQQYLIKVYSGVDTMLRQLPLLQAQITDQLAAFNKG